MATEIKENSYFHKGNKKRFVILAIYLLILVLLYYYLVKLNFNPIIILVLLIFIFLITLGPILKRTKGTLYSRMFPDKKRRSSNDKRRSESKETKEIQIQTKVPKSINLDFRYSKPLIKKCVECGNILPNFVKKCPFCNSPVN